MPSLLSQLSGSKNHNGIGIFRKAHNKSAGKKRTSVRFFSVQGGPLYLFHAFFLPVMCLGAIWVPDNQRNKQKSSPKS